jgi:nitroreductase
MNVSDAVAHRRSIRAFRPDPVPAELVRSLLQRAGRAPSGGNLQPWHVHALTGDALRDLLGRIRADGRDAVPGYAIYPENLWDPYRSRRFKCGEDLYATIPVAREDKAGRFRHLGRNAEFFGAPVGLFLLIDRNMGRPQWADLGMYLQTLMLLAIEEGLDTCAQEYWSLFSKSVEGFLDVPNEQMLFCGLALGYRDANAPINSLRTDRASLDEWAHLHGF